MKREYWFVIITYIVMQLSSIIGVPILAVIGTMMGFPADEVRVKSGAYWIVFSFFAALILVVFFMRKDMKDNINARNQASITASAVWTIAGVFLALFSQSIAGVIEQMIGIDPGSENTQQILSLIEQVPLVIFVSSVIGPILEEIIFRKIIFGSLYKRYNFFISALVSSVIFGLAHFELVHILLYSAMGFTFAFLYVKTKRIIVPILAHISMNTLVVIFQSVYQDDIEKMMREMETIQGFIGGLL
ncbi:CPBP family intramembrane metalloprotease [Peribacillus cavernae]|uniref:CPBP family intramembrane metalloprotease n=1 Tax=Peribacillus cavernae TaxID=1674310 RepID=A0A3S0W4G6_9BACI|nr:type II CAAX endopeptidase family protein [Peribacillus cavernae]MDQ0221371.1 membrane protease YdiL (CAAX protease family) [Peribacillus cavernae]RUQ27516.1 CPBP family intramembrane metalloprotease [Peribacillus cavernae]